MRLFLPTVDNNDDDDELEELANDSPAAICRRADKSSKVNDDDTSRDEDVGFDVLSVSSATYRDVIAEEPPPETEVFFAWRDWRGLFYVALVYGSTFFACWTGADPACLVAFVSVAAFASFFLPCRFQSTRRTTRGRCRAL